MGDRLVELRPDTKTFALHEPAADDGDRDDDAEGVEEADGPAHLDDRVELGDRNDHEEHEQDHEVTLATPVLASPVGH